MAIDADTDEETTRTAKFLSASMKTWVQHPELAQKKNKKKTDAYSPNSGEVGMDEFIGASWPASQSSKVWVT